MNLDKEIHILNQSLNALREEVHEFNMQMRIRIYSVTARLDKLNEVLKADAEEKEESKENKAGIIEVSE